MKAQDYKDCKKKLGILNPDIWAKQFGISKDTDKSYSCGRNKIPEHVANEIYKLINDRDTIVEELVAIIKKAFPDSLIKKDVDTCNISLEIDSFEQPIEFINKGKDHLGYNVFRFRNPDGIDNVLIYYRKRLRNSNTIEQYWTYWRSEPAPKIHVKYAFMQNYQNELTIELLNELMMLKKRY